MNRNIAHGASALVLASLAGCGPHAPSVDGNWAMVSARLGGADLPMTLFRGGVLELSAGNYVFQNDTGTYTLATNVTPMSIDVHGVHGPNAGKTIPAILDIRGDSMTICYDLSGTSRPTAFRSDTGTQLFLVHYVRKTS